MVPETVDLTTDGPAGVPDPAPRQLAPKVEAGQEHNVVIDIAGACPEPPQPQPKRRKRGPGRPAASEVDEAGPSQPSNQDKPDRRRVKKPKPEKRKDASGRTVKFLPNPSIKVQERICRARPDSNHRMFLIDRQRTGAIDDENVKETFAVLGATGNGMN